MPVEVRAGDGIELAPEILAELPGDIAPVVFHSFTFNQVARPDRERFDELMTELSTGGPIHRLSLEWFGAPARSPELIYTLYDGGASKERHLANVHHHGAWLEWLGG